MNNDYLESYMIPKGKLIRDSNIVFDASSLEYLGKGANSSVWKYIGEDDSYAFKYFFSTGRNCALNMVTYDRMINLDLPCFTKALEFCRDANHGFITGYLENLLVENKELSLLQQNSSLFLENMMYLEKSIQELSTNHVFMYDVKPSNSIFHNDDGMLYISDIDMFFVNDMYTVQDVLSFNYGMLNALYRQRFLNEIEVSCEFEAMEKRNLAIFISDIFPTRNRDSSSLLPVAKKYFLKTDTPKQYLLKRLEK